MKIKPILIAFLSLAASATAQSRDSDLAAILQTPLETPDVVAFQLRQYMYQRIPRLETPATGAQWTTLPSSGTAEQEFLTALIEHLGGTPTAVRPQP